MPNSDKNPFPSDIPKKKPPHDEAGRNWNWTPGDSSLGVNPATSSEFDNENTWYEEGYTDEAGKRSYPGKHLNHRFPHVSIHGKTGSLVGKAGYLYRLIDCTIEQLSAEGACIIYANGCTIQKITGAATTCVCPSCGYVGSPSGSGCGTCPDCGSTLSASTTSKGRMHFTDCEIYDVENVNNYHMVFDGLTEFKTPQGSAQFNGVQNSSVMVFSSPAWDLANGKSQMVNFDNCHVVVSGPAEVYNVLTDSMHSGFKDCTYVAMGQWFCSEARGGCTQPGSPWVTMFNGFEDCDIISMGVTINNPEWYAGMFKGMDTCNVVNINPNYVVHADFFQGESCNICVIGGTLDNCDVIHFHVKNSTACCINSTIKGEPGWGSILQSGTSDNSSLVVAGGQVDVDDGAAPVFAAKNCTMRFYDCTLVRQKGDQDLFANEEDCDVRLYCCDQIISVQKKTFNEKKDCRLNLFGNTRIEATDDDLAVMGDNCVMQAKYNTQLFAKKKVIHLTDDSGLITQRNELLQSQEDEVLTVTGQSHVRLNQDTKLLTSEGDVIVSVANNSRLSSYRTWMKGDMSTYGLQISSDSIVDLLRDKIESNNHVVSVSNSRFTTRYQQFLSSGSIGIIGSSSYIDALKGTIQTSDSEISLTNCEGTIKEVTLMGPGRIVLSSSKIYVVNQNATKVTATGGSIFLTNVTLSDSLSASAVAVCRIASCSIQSASVSGGLLFSGLSSYQGVNFTASLGLVSGDSCGSMIVSGIYVLSNVQCSGISATGIVIHDNVSCDKLSFPAKRGVYGTGDLDFFAVDNVYITSETADIIAEALVGSIKEVAAQNIEEEAGRAISETAGTIASTDAPRIDHN